MRTTARVLSSTCGDLLLGPCARFVTAAVLLLIFICVTVGCSSRAYTSSRSERLARASAEAGASLRSVEEDRAIFDEYEAANQKRLEETLEERLRAKSDSLRYQIGPNDEIEVHVFDVPELNFTAKVTEGGFLPVPLIGSVKAAGLSADDLTASVRTALMSYVKDPRVSLAVVGFSSQRVAVLGAVRNPGVYPLKKGSTGLLEVIGEAGGLTPKAGSVISLVPSEKAGIGPQSDVYDRARLTLTSSQREDLKGIEIAAEQVLGTSGRIPIEIPLQGGDTVIVPDAGTVVVEGEVQRIGAYELGQQMTLLGALAAAGGITFGANVNEVEVVRMFGSRGKASLLINLEEVALGTREDVRLRAGDLIRVPTDTERRISQDTFEGITRVLNFGVGGHVNVGR